MISLYAFQSPPGRPYNDHTLGTKSMAIKKAKSNINGLIVKFEFIMIVILIFFSSSQQQNPLY